MLTIRKGQIMPWQDVSGPHEIDQDKVDRIAEAMERGDNFPPVRVVQYDGHFHIIDGHHRVAAAKWLDFPIPALIADGEAFEDLDRDLIADGAGRADDVQHWLPAL